jgi:hypothetical protein
VTSNGFQNDTIAPIDRCAYVRSLSDERLNWLISTPPLGLDLLEHAVYCEECGKRIKAIGDQDFGNLSPEEQKRLHDWSVDFVARNFPVTDEADSIRKHVELEQGTPVALSPTEGRGVSHLCRLLAQRRAPTNWELHQLRGITRSIELPQGSFQPGLSFAPVLGSPTVEYEHDLSGLLDDLGLADDFIAFKLFIQRGDHTRAGAVLIPRTNVAPTEAHSAVRMEIQLADVQGQPLSRRRIVLTVGVGTRSSVPIGRVAEPETFAGQITIALREIPVTGKDKDTADD